MTIQETIENNFKQLLRNPSRNNPKIKEKINHLRLIKGELQRLNEKILTNETTIKVLKQLHKLETERLQYVPTQTTSNFLTLLNNYLPKMADEKEITDWIKKCKFYSVQK